MYYSTLGTVFGYMSVRDLGCWQGRKDIEMYRIAQRLNDQELGGRQEARKGQRTGEPPGLHFMLLLLLLLLRDGCNFQPSPPAVITSQEDLIGCTQAKFLPPAYLVNLCPLDSVMKIGHYFLQDCMYLMTLNERSGTNRKLDYILDSVPLERERFYGPLLWLSRTHMDFAYHTFA